MQKLSLLMLIQCITIRKFLKTIADSMQMLSNLI